MVVSQVPDVSRKVLVKLLNTMRRGRVQSQDLEICTNLAKLKVGLATIISPDSLDPPLCCMNGCKGVTNVCVLFHI